MKKLSSQPARSSDAGVTLVEVLVVLMMIGLLAAVVSFSVSGSSANRSAIDSEAELLGVRLERAAVQAMVRGNPARINWSDQGYQFYSFSEGDWFPHSDPILGDMHSFDRAITIASAGEQVLRTDMLPPVQSAQTLSPLILRLMGRNTVKTVIFDGVSVRTESVTR